ncbi:MAG TPA: Hint domain-containing protein, partial [Acetobacteraceae bacterium]
RRAGRLDWLVMPESPFQPLHSPVLPVGGFAQGTRLATPAGPVAAELLLPGDHLLSATGVARRILRTERQVLVAGALRLEEEERPVHIEPGALGGGLPREGLVLAPAQAVLLDGMAVAAASLVNGASIRRLPAGAPATLFRLQTGGPDDVVAAGVTCRLARVGARVPVAAHLRLRALAGQRPGNLLGHIDAADRRGVSGWATDSDHPQAPVLLEVLCGRSVLGAVLADQPRSDMDGARRGFAFRFRPPLAPRAAHLVSVRRAGDAAALPGGLVLLPSLPPGLDLDAALAAAPADATALAGLIAGISSALR